LPSAPTTSTPGANSKDKAALPGRGWVQLCRQRLNLTIELSALLDSGAPRQRYHPAMVAQAVATLAEMFPNRFWLTVGSGQALNEQITGDKWPIKSDRNARLNPRSVIFCS